MFDSIFPKHWTTLQRLMWLKTNALARAVYETITGNPVTFTAKKAPLRQLKVAFSPVQDLHGYDSPWPAGGGANKYGGSALKSSLLAVTGAEGGSDSNGSYVNIPASTALNDVTLFDGFAENTQYTVIFKILPTGNAATNIRVYYSDNTYNTITTSADGSLTTVTYTTTAGKTVSAIKLGYWYISTCKIYYDDCGVFVGANQPFSPYSNECPISGWSSLLVEQRGGNLADQSAMTHTGVGNDNGGIMTSAQRLFTPNAPCKAGSLLYVKVVGESSQSEVIFVNRIIFFDKDGVFVQRGQISGTAPRVEGYINVPDNCQYFSVDLRTSALTTDIIVSDVSQLMVAISNYVPVPYVPYNPLSRSISISLGSTIYSGYVDVISGVGEVTMASVDLSDLAWTYYANLLRFRAALPSNIKPAQSAASPLGVNAICSNYRLVGYNQSSGAGGNGTFGLDTNGYIAINDQQYTDATTFASAMQNVQLICELATPIPIQLTPQEVESLLGDNVMWSDANGDLTVEYRSN